MVWKHPPLSDEIQPIEIKGKPFELSRWDLPLSENNLLAAIALGAILGLITGLLIH